MDGFRRVNQEIFFSREFKILCFEFVLVACKNFQKEYKYSGDFFVV